VSFFGSVISTFTSPPSLFSTSTSWFEIAVFPPPPPLRRFRFFVHLCGCGGVCTGTFGAELTASAAAAAVVASAAASASACCCCRSITADGLEPLSANVGVVGAVTTASCVCVLGVKAGAGEARAGGAGAVFKLSGIDGDENLPETKIT
jgi:hypothetical protein